MWTAQAKYGRRLELVELLLQQQRVRAQVDELLALDQLVARSRRSRGGSAARRRRSTPSARRSPRSRRRACSTGIRRRRTWSGCWILPQPAQARLHWNSGSSSTSSGNFSRLASSGAPGRLPIRRLCLQWNGHQRRTSHSAGSVERGHSRSITVVLHHLDAARALTSAATTRCDEALRRRGAGGHADRPASASQAGSISPSSSTRCAGQPARSATSTRRTEFDEFADPTTRTRRTPRRGRAPRPGGSGSRSRCRRSAARPGRGTARGARRRSRSSRRRRAWSGSGRRPDRGPRPRPRARRGGPRPGGSTRAPRPWSPRPPRGPRGRPARPCSRPRRTAGPRRGPW